MFKSVTALKLSGETHRHTDTVFYSLGWNLRILIFLYILNHKYSPNLSILMDPSLTIFKLGGSISGISVTFTISVTSSGGLWPVTRPGTRAVT